MLDGGTDAPPPVKRKRGRPRKADILAAAAAAAGADSSVIVAPVNVNGVLAVSNVPGIPALKAEPKPRKSRKKKGEVAGPVAVDTNLVGKTVTGVLDGSFDAGYLLSVRVGDSETVLRGAVFGPGLTVPVSKTNDVAQGVKVIKREENLHLPAASPFSVLVSPGPTPASAHPSQIPPSTATAAALYLHVAPTAPPKALPTPAGSSVPAFAPADSNSQVTTAQIYPTVVPQGTLAA